jgi:hypothetical protein
VRSSSGRQNLTGLVLHELVLQDRVHLEGHERRVHRDHRPWLRRDQVSDRPTICRAVRRSHDELTSGLLFVLPVERNPAATSSEMRRNLLEICDTLRKKGKKVCLATVASPDPTATEADSASSTLNTALEHFCKRYEKKSLRDPYPRLTQLHVVLWAARRRKKLRLS